MKYAIASALSGAECWVMLRLLRTLVVPMFLFIFRCPVRLGMCAEPSVPCGALVMLSSKDTQHTPASKQWHARRVVSANSAPHLHQGKLSSQKEIPAYPNQWRKVGAFEVFQREIFFRKNSHLDRAALQTEFYLAEPWAAPIEGGIRRLKLLPQLSHV